MHHFSACPQCGPCLARPWGGEGLTPLTRERGSRVCWGSPGPLGRRGHSPRRAAWGRRLWGLTTIESRTVYGVYSCIAASLLISIMVSFSVSRTATNASSCFLMLLAVRCFLRFPMLSMLSMLQFKSPRVNVGTMVTSGYFAVTMVRLSVLTSLILFCRVQVCASCTKGSGSRWYLHLCMDLQRLPGIIPLNQFICNACGHCRDLPIAARMDF